MTVVSLAVITSREERAAKASLRRTSAPYRTVDAYRRAPRRSLPLDRENGVGHASPTPSPRAAPVLAVAPNAFPDSPAADVRHGRAGADHGAAGRRRRATHQRGTDPVEARQGARPHPSTVRYTAGKGCCSAGPTTRRHGWLLAQQGLALQQRIRAAAGPTACYTAARGRQRCGHPDDDIFLEIASPFCRICTLRRGGAAWRLVQEWRDHLCNPRAPGRLPPRNEPRLGAVPELFPAMCGRAAVAASRRPRSRFLHRRLAEERGAPVMTCADPAMPTSFIHDVSTQYLAAVMFALTVAAAGAVRAAWRRRRCCQERRQSLRPPSSAPLTTTVEAERNSTPSQAARTSSSRRRRESS